MEEKNNNPMLKLYQNSFDDEIDKMIHYLTNCKEGKKAPLIKEIGFFIDMIYFYHDGMEKELEKG